MISIETATQDDINRIVLMVTPLLLGERLGFHDRQHTIKLVMESVDCDYDFAVQIVETIISGLTQ